MNNLQKQHKVPFCMHFIFFLSLSLTPTHTVRQAGGMEWGTGSQERPASVIKRTQDVSSHKENHIEKQKVVGRMNERSVWQCGNIQTDEWSKNSMNSKHVSNIMGAHVKNHGSAGEQRSYILKEDTSRWWCTKKSVTTAPGSILEQKLPNIHLIVEDTGTLLCIHRVLYISTPSVNLKLQFSISLMDELLKNTGSWLWNVFSDIVISFNRFGTSWYRVCTFLPDTLPFDYLSNLKPT